MLEDAIYILIAREEKSVPDFKAFRDKLTLFMG